jgi:hypothetical protein
MNRKDTSATEKQVRLEHANALIKIIASYGRRFFWHGGSSQWDEATKNHVFVPADRLARFELTKGRLYFIDDYTEQAILLPRPYWGRSNWRGFSHGGTLRSLVEAMSDYIRLGTPVPRWQIVIQYLGEKGLERNIWGYDAKAAEAVRTEAYALPIVEPEVAAV